MSRAKHRMYSEEYYDLSEEEMQAIVKRAQQADESAQKELLKIFSNFLTKYVNMLYYGKYSLGDYDIRRFLSLFISNSNLRRSLSRNKLDASQRREVDEALGSMRFMIKRYGNLEDVQQTVDVTFLHCVDIYEKQGEVPFSGYLYSYFLFILKKNIETMLISQLGLKTFPLIDPSSDFDADDGPREPGFLPPDEHSVEFDFAPDYIDELWVAGDTAYPPFDVLTVQERQIIKWRYVNDNKSSEIAEKITEHPNTVRDHINKIKAKIMKAMEEELKD